MRLRQLRLMLANLVAGEEPTPRVVCHHHMFGVLQVRGLHSELSNLNVGPNDIVYVHCGPNTPAQVAEMEGHMLAEMLRRNHIRYAGIIISADTITALSPQMMRDAGWVRAPKGTP